ncbi:MAG: twin-arginine translocase subunit TatC [Erysipelotrichaceae bacterium]
MSKEVKESMHVVDHLKELRNRIIITIITFVVAMLIAFNFSGTIVNFLLEHGLTLGYEFIYLSPSELFMQYLRVAIILAVAFSIPVIFYQIWAFIRPVFDKKDNLKVLLAMVFGLAFFCLGALFSFYIVSPFLLHFFYNINQSLDYISAQISISNYIGFYTSNFLTFGLIFELPVVTTLLTYIGILQSDWLVRMRKLVIVGIFVAGAIITPPEIISQIMVAIPMILLYEFSVAISKLVDKAKNKYHDNNS